MYPYHQIRARHDARTVRVYQAFRPAIADAALAAGRFVPPFKRERMTWIKPSFAWMMYRCGWATKVGQERVLGIDLARDGFEWALAHACSSHYQPERHATHAVWQTALAASPVRIQWDPERDLRLRPLPWRSLQLGLSGPAVARYVDAWIVRIEDVTPLAREVHAASAQGDLARAQALAPVEPPYPVPAALAAAIDLTV